MSEQLLRVGITQGDPNGIGWEVILKALADPRMTEICTPVLYGSAAAATYYQNSLSEAEPLHLNRIVSAHEARRGRVNIVVTSEITPTPGKACAEGGKAAVEALKAAVHDLKEGRLDALVTAPFDKEMVQGEEFRHTGHTEFFGAEFAG